MFYNKNKFLILNWVLPSKSMAFVFSRKENSFKKVPRSVKPSETKKFLGTQKFERRVCQDQKKKLD